MCSKTAALPLDGVLDLPGEDRPWEPGGIMGCAGDGARPLPEVEASVYRDRIVAMGRKGRASHAAQAGRLIIEHGEDALRWVLRECAPGADRMRIARHLEQAGLTADAPVAERAAALMAKHGDEALRWVLRTMDPSADRLRLVRHLEQAGLTGPVQVEAFG